MSSHASESCPSSPGSDYDSNGKTYVEQLDDLKEDFFFALDDIRAHGDIACMSQYSQHVDPGLMIAGSPIIIPLGSRDIGMFKTICQQSSFRRDDDTFVDVSKRKARLFRCSNPKWPAFLGTILDETFQKLGILTHEAYPVLSELVFSGDGSHITLRNESEKIHRSIGKLMICLPSKHKGGDVHFSYSNRHHAFATADNSEFDITALAWYSDVQRDIKPPTSGYRLTISYDLIHSGCYALSACLFTEQESRLQNLLTRYRAIQIDPDRKIVHTLNHRYSELSLSIRSLKELDAPVVRCLKQACEETGFRLLLALMTEDHIDSMHESPGVPDGDYWVEGTDVSVKYIMNVDGNCISEDVGVDNCEILRTRPYRDNVGREEDPSESEYLRCAVFIVPSWSLGSFLKPSGPCLANLLRMVCFSTAASAEGDARREALDFLSQLLQTVKLPIKEANLLTLILRACKVWSPDDLYHKAMRKAAKSSPTVIAKAIVEIANEFIAHPEDSMWSWSKCFGELVSDLDGTSLEKLLRLVQRQLEDTALKESFKRWRPFLDNERVENHYLTTRDLPFVLRTIESHTTDDKWISEVLLRNLSRRAEKQLLYDLIQKYSAKDDIRALRDTGSLARRLLEKTLAKLHLDNSAFESPDGSPSTVNKFITLLNNCFGCGLEDKGKQLLSDSYQKMSEDDSRHSRKESTSSHPMDMRQGKTSIVTDRGQLARTFLEYLISVSDKHPSVDPRSFKQLFVLLFEKYVVPDKPQPPSEPRAWSRKKLQPPRGFSRDDWNDIDQFIQDPRRRAVSFNHLDQRRASQIKEILPTQHYECTIKPRRMGLKTDHALIVTKAVTKDGRSTEYEEDRKEFYSQLEEYEKKLLKFRELKPTLRRILGNETYNALIMLGRVSGTKRGASKNPDEPAFTRQRTGNVLN